MMSMISRSFFVSLIISLGFVTADEPRELIAEIENAKQICIALNWSGGIVANGEKFWVDLFRAGEKVVIKPKRHPRKVELIPENRESTPEPLGVVRTFFILDTGSSIWLLEVRLDGLVIAKKTSPFVLVSETEEDLKFLIVEEQIAEEYRLVCKDLVEQLTPLIEERMKKILESGE